jgi:hypothetical protein
MPFKLGQPKPWDRSPEWSQFRSAGRQRCERMYRMRLNRRVRRYRSARCEKRGVKSDQGFGVATLGTDGPARRSRWLIPAWWTRPPPIPRCVPPRATNRMTRPPRRSPPQEAARGFWLRAWGQRGHALQRTGRSNDPARSLGLLEGGLDDPRHSRQSQLTSHRTPDPNAEVPRFSHSSVKSGSLSFMRITVSLNNDPLPVMHQPVDQGRGQGVVHVKDLAHSRKGRFVVITIDPTS